MALLSGKSECGGGWVHVPDPDRAPDRVAPEVGKRFEGQQSLLAVASGFVIAYPETVWLRRWLVSQLHLSLRRPYRNTNPHRSERRGTPGAWCLFPTGVLS